jgi:FkbM family methyltransferase
MRLDEYYLLPWACRQGDVALDVGAQVGDWTALLAIGFRTVHAIEPNPELRPQLLKNLPSNAVHHPVGAWSTTARLPFRNSKKLSALSRHVDIDTGSGESSVECLPLDSLPITGAVDFIKCDAEGAEGEILRGAAGLIRHHRPWLLLEVHTADNFLQVVALLAQWSYLFTTIRDYIEIPFSYRWYEHCWVSAQASEKCPRSHWMTAAD